MPTDLPPQYDPKSVETRIYQQWLDAKCFHAEADPNHTRTPFSIVIPPPNVTGALHLGHAINGTIQDILTRYHRMKGENTLWMPGIDHAGIATQAVVEKTIFEKEKKTRHDLGREELVRRIWEWKENFGTRILKQLASIGASCDWDRTRFTLDDICARAVREAFFKMFKDGLIFRGKRLVNWDTHLQTAVADDEIYYETLKGQMTSIKYPIDGSPNEYLIVATTRPETMLGDTAVAVHPDDPRYTHLHGKHVIVPLVGRKIPIITDGLLVDPAFGTGVVKVTPAHDPNDYATGQRHNLEQINLLTPDGKVNEKGSGTVLGKNYNYTGLKFATAARKQILADLEALGLIADAKPHDHEVGHSDRSKTPIEPYLSDQWFVRMGDIAEATTSPSEPRPSGSDRATSSEPKKPHSPAVAYFLTFHTFATWLHGQEPGAVDPDHNQHGAPFLPPDPKHLEMKLANLKDPPFTLTLEQRQSVLKTIQEVSAHRGWTVHAANIRSTHVHAVISGPESPDRMMNDFKSYATRRLREANLATDESKIWSRHGSTRYLWKMDDVHSAVTYTLHSQGENAAGTFMQRSETPANSDFQRSLPDGRGSENTPGITLADGTHSPGLAQAAMDAVTSSRVKITPERYAKGYLDWLAQKRDWCISRQLWWGHRIPVWTFSISGIRFDASPGTAEFDSTVESNDPLNPEAFPYSECEAQQHFDSATGKQTCYICPPPDRPDIEDALNAAGLVQDPDVLDTWFSSALWPISTMGWPQSNLASSEPRPSGSDRGASEAKTNSQIQGSLPHGRGSDGIPPEPGLLQTFYPTSVLSTAREILTLWVARMVIFGLYCHGDVPFKDVYIHAVIQDGEGRPMKKSLGNGVDPVDIVASHGADALRFTLASMATETQDIRMPVVKDPTTGINTSPKFDIGRNFANKIWNASRFILGNVDEKLEARSKKQVEALEDRWILSRLNHTIIAAETAINAYRFADLSTALYQFFWSDLCDWYLEIAKSRIKSGDATVQAVLLECLETSLKLLHPMMPFISEAIWEKLPGLDGMLIKAPWPKADPAATDPAAEEQLAMVQSLTTAIREIQNRYPAAKGKPVVIAPRDAKIQAIIAAAKPIIEPLTNTTIAENSPTAQKPADSATAVLPDLQLFIGGVIDKNAESAKLKKRAEELQKFIAAGTAKLGNEAAVAKAPPQVVAGWRDQLAKQQAELAAVTQSLKELN